MALHIKKIKPLLTDILTTAHRYEDDVTKGGIITNNKETKGWVKDYQVVVEVGPLVRDIKIGDKVAISFKNYEVKRYDPNSVKEDMGMNSTIGYNLPCVVMDDKNGNPQEYLRLTERDIMYVFEGEEIPDTIILPEKPKIITN